MKSKTYVCFTCPAVSCISICLVIGIALSQTRPLKPTGTIKTKLGRAAVIEQPAFPAMMIKGRILDPNNEPAYGSRIVALPVTSRGSSIRLNNEEGYFRLSWSPTWIAEGQPVSLIAMGHYQRNEGAFVKITDPTQPVVVRLESASELVGKVTDSNGQLIPKYKATLSLATEFKCQAPIFETSAGSWGERIFKTIPYGTKYRLIIQADGFRTRQITVDATDRTKKIIDIGTITLQPQDPAKSGGAKKIANPDLAKEFHNIYRLEDKEVIKLVKPPFVLGRQEFLRNNFIFNQHIALQEGDGWHYRYIWDGELKIGDSGFSTRRKLDDVLYIMLRLSHYDYDIPEELNIRMPDGDWIIRTKSSMAEQLRALEDIIYAETNRAIRFEKLKVEREVIVVKGQYKFKPHPNGLSLNHIPVTWDGTPGVYERTVNSLSEFFRHLEHYIKMKIVDESEPVEETTIKYKMSKNLEKLGNSDDVKKEFLGGFLFNLSLTTSLRFTVEHRPAEIWFVTEIKDN